MPKTSLSVQRKLLLQRFCVHDDGGGDDDDYDLHHLDESTI